MKLFNDYLYLPMSHIILPRIHFAPISFCPPPPYHFAPPPLEFRLIIYTIYYLPMSHII